MKTKKPMRNSCANKSKTCSSRGCACPSLNARSILTSSAIPVSKESSASAFLGRNSYRNLVSCCLECNSQKRERSAEDFLRWLYRQRRLTAVELTARLRALDALASGKLPPPLAPTSNPLPRKGRPPLHPAAV